MLKNGAIIVGTLVFYKPSLDDARMAAIMYDDMLASAPLQCKKLSPHAVLGLMTIFCFIFML
jgi:hypothetical protein